MLTFVCGVVQQRQEELLSLWQTALSAEAAQSLDMKRYLTASLVWQHPCWPNHAKIQPMSHSICMRNCSHSMCGKNPSIRE